jgi:lipoprotein-releasing system permease protein
MFRPLAIYIGLRYTRAKRRNHFISFISFSSMLGIALGVAALITVLSVMNGFEKEVRARILDMVAHMTISNYEGKLNDWKDVVVTVKKQPEVIAAAPYVQSQGMLIRGRYVRGAAIRGILPDQEPSVSNVGKKMVAGNLAAGEYKILLGQGLARALGLGIGEKVTIVTPSTNVTPAGVSPRMKRFTVAGIFSVGHDFYDNSIAIIHLTDAKKLFRMKNEVTGVRVKLENLFLAPNTTARLAETVFPDLWIRDWSTYQSNWFRAVKREKIMIFLLLLLIVAVAAFNILSTLVMVVTDKQSDIAILRTLGASPKMVTNIFIVQGTIIGLVGTSLGIIGGVLLALNIDVVVPWIEKLLGIQILDKSIYYISDLPSDLHWNDVGLIGIVSFLICIFSTIYPAYRASRTQPADALRYE